MTANPMTAITENWQAAADDESYRRYFGIVLSGQRAGKGVLPFFLGLQPVVLLWLAQRYLADKCDARCVLDTCSHAAADARQRGDLRQELLEMRRDEWTELRDLLLQYRAGRHPLESAMADIVAAACLGGDHLWRDLGLDSRQQLSELLTLNFPDLAHKNNKDMKWKKFFYKQLCEQEGGYVCRAPSCEECAAYDDCFGNED